MAFDESKIKRADDGRFGSKPGSHDKKPKSDSKKEDGESDDHQEESDRHEQLKKWADSNEHVKHAVATHARVSRERDEMAHAGDRANRDISVVSERQFGDKDAIKELIAEDAEWAHTADELDESLSYDVNESTFTQYDADATTARVMESVRAISADEGRPLSEETHRAIESAVRNNVETANRQNAWMHAIKTSASYRPLVKDGMVDLGGDALFSWAKNVAGKG